MTIDSAIERGSFIFVYDQHGRTLFSNAKGSGAKGRIAGTRRLHRHRPLRLNHLHVRRTQHDDLRQGGVTGS